MAAVVFALVLAVLLFWLEQYSCVHSLDDVQGGWKRKITLLRRASRCS